MITREQIVEIIKAGCLAPSGDNKQPWCFEVKNDDIFLINIPEADTIGYNFDQHGSYIAHGAALYNMQVKAESLGIDLDIQLFPEKGNNDLVARIHCIASSPRENNLVHSIDKRCSVRIKYSNSDLNQDTKYKLQQLQNDNVVVLFPNVQEKKQIGSILSLNEKVLLSTESIHQGFFNGLIWNKDEEHQKRKGMFVSTLGLNPPQRFIFKMLSNWSICKFLHKFGIGNFIASENAKVWGSADAYYAFMANDNSPESMVRVGMEMERVWLTVVSMGLSGHLFGGLTALGRGILKGKIRLNNSVLESEVIESYNSLKSHFKIGNKDIIVLLRVGSYDGVVHNSLKLEPNIKFSG